MLLPQTAEYALRATIRIADHQRAAPGAWVRVGDIAAAVDVPRNYLSKTLHQLVRAGVLVSTRGPAGGFRLAVPADELTLARVATVFAAGAEPHGQRCLLGTGPCGANPDCPVHTRWKPVATRVAAFFGSTTIGDVLGRPDGLPTAADDRVLAGPERARGDLPSPPSPTRRPARQESTP
jgi:Rrf2 family protein